MKMEGSMLKSSEFTKDLYGMGETVEILGVSTKTIQNLCNSGELGCAKSEYGWRKIPREALLNYLDRNGKLFRDDERDNVIKSLIEGSESLSFVIDALLEDDSYFSYVDVIADAIRYRKGVKS